MSPAGRDSDYDVGDGNAYHLPPPQLEPEAHVGRDLRPSAGSCGPKEERRSLMWAKMRAMPRIVRGNGRRAGDNRAQSAFQNEGQHALEKALLPEAFVEEFHPNLFVVAA